MLRFLERTLGLLVGLVLLASLALLPATTTGAPVAAEQPPAVDRLIERFQQVEARLGQGPQVGTTRPAVAVRGPVVPGAPAATDAVPPGGVR